MTLDFRQVRRVASISSLLVVSSLLASSPANATQIAVSDGEGTEGTVPAGPGAEQVVSRTEYSTTTTSELGQYSTTVGSAPVNYFSDEGNGWIPIDNRLIATDMPDYSHMNRSNSYDLIVPEDTSKDPFIFTMDEHQVSFALSGSEGKPNISGNTATMETADSNTTVALSATNTGVKEDTILAERPGEPPLFRYSLSTSNSLTPHLLSDRSIEFRDNSGEAVLNMPTPFMYDSGVGIDQQYSDDLHVALDKVGSGAYDLRIRPSFEWLSEARIEYPVTIDPTLSRASERTCWIGSVVVNQSACADPHLRTGSNADGAQRALLKFNLGSLPPLAAVEAATLSLHLNANLTSGNGDAASIDAHLLTQSWNDNATWRSPDSTTNRTWQGGGPFVNAHGSDHALDSVWLAGSVTERVEWDVLEAVERWTQGTDENRGLLLKQHSETVATTLFFASEQNPSAQARPALTIDWFDPSVSPMPEYDRALLQGAHACAIEENVVPVDSTPQQTVGWVDPNGSSTPPRQMTTVPKRWTVSMALTLH